MSATRNVNPSIETPIVCGLLFSVVIMLSPFLSPLTTLCGCRYTRDEPCDSSCGYCGYCGYCTITLSVIPGWTVQYIENVPAVLNGPIVMLPPLTCLSFTNGAPGSLADFGVEPSHAPLVIICRKLPSSTSFSMDPLAIVTVGCEKLAIPMCTVPGSVDA